MRVCKWLMIVCIIWAVPVSAHAELERTVWAWDTRTPDPGHFRTDVGYTYGDYDYWGMDAEGESVDVELLVSYGITSHWSLGMMTTWSSWEEKVFGSSFSRDGIGDTQAVTTLRVLDEKQSGIDLAFRLALSMPTGDDDNYIGSGHWEPKFEILAAKSFGPVLTVVNLGGKQIIDGADTEEEFVFNGDLECVLPLAECVSANAALSGWTSRWKESEDDRYLQVGAGLKVRPREKTFISGMVYRLVETNRLRNAWYFSLGVGIEF